MLRCVVYLLLMYNVDCILKKYERHNFWRVFGYDIDGVQYTNDTDYEQKEGTFSFQNEVLEEHEKFLIQKNLVPYGTVFFNFDQVISIPRTRPGIPSTLNSMSVFNYKNRNNSPLLKPFPSTKEAKDIVSVFDVVGDGCRRLWMVDTGLIDIPGHRRQVKKPRILIISSHRKVIYFMKEIDPAVLRNGVSSGLRTVAVDFIYPCSESYMYINDDSSNAVIVFSLKDASFKRIERPNTRDEAWTFQVPKSIVNYMTHVVRYRNFPNETFLQYSPHLESTIADQEKLNSDIVDLSGPKSNPLGVLYDRSPEHNILFFTNEERTHLFCWNVDTPMVPENVAMLTQISRDNDFYIADLDTTGYVLQFIVNRVRGLHENIYDETKINFGNYRITIDSMLNNTVCAQRTKCSNFLANWKHDYPYTIGPIKYFSKYVTQEFIAQWNKDVETIWQAL